MLQFSSVTTLGGLEITHTHWHRALGMAEHTHQHSRLVLVLAGEFDESYAEHGRRCSRGSLIYRPAYEKHGEHFITERGGYVSVSVPVGWLRQHGVAASQMVSGRAASSERTVKIGEALVCALTRADPWSLSFGALTLELVAQLEQQGVSSSSRYPIWIDAVREVIGANPASPQPLSKLAALAGVHPTHLARAFKSHVGVTIGMYVRIQRAEMARTLIRQSAGSIAEVAALAGFYDQSHFDRTFRRFFGVAPAEYRRARATGQR